jgi:hypothetical protein
MLPIGHGPRDLTATLEVDGQLSRDLPCLRAVPRLQAQADAKVSTSS